ncbi:hypothetical protein [Amphibiibacter pelophylacis]|uniref:Uncharacterized protein n=1 Tax=Amphibiibacter pelophylacis TaxID=1799477 RepID=A0ACC6P1S4_9BURK
MYEFILEQKLATVLAAIFLALLSSSLVGAGKLWFKGLIYNFTPAFAAAFYTVAFFALPRPDSADLFAGLLFETTVLALFFRLLLKLKREMMLISEIDAVRGLMWTLVLQLALAYPNMSMSGFGLFSDGSRIDYLSASSLAKYYTYAGFLISTIQAVLVASLVTIRGYLGLWGYLVIAANLALSVLAGSKGGVFLWLLAIASLIDYKRAKIRTYKFIIIVLIGLVSMWASSLIIAEFLNLQIADFINIAISRFFLNNDARALALDLRTSQTSDISFFSEAFRSLGNLLGLQPRNDPLGVILYEEGLSITNGSGANASFMALSTYYFPAGFALVPALLGMLGVFFLVGINMMSVKLVFRPTHRAVITSIWLATLMIFSQDFLSFQVMLPIAVLSVFIIWLSQKKFYVFAKKTPQSKH